jgi:hypothetical protein
MQHGCVSSKIEFLLLEQIIKPLVGYKEDEHGNESFGDDSNEVVLRIKSRLKQAKRARFDAQSERYMAADAMDPNEDIVTITMEGNTQNFGM